MSLFSSENRQSFGESFENKCFEHNRESGASMLEYALIAALVSVVCVGVLTIAGRQACTSLSRVASSLSVANN